MISRGSTKRWHVAAGAVVALALVGTACSGDDDDDSADEVEDTTGDTTAEEPAAEEPAAEEPATDDTVEVTQDGGLLDAVRERDVLQCGVNNELPGFGVVDDAGVYSGFDVDYCKVVAAGVLGDSTKVEYIPLSSEARFTALTSGEVDVLIRNTTATATRDGELGVNFLTTTFYDGQGVMVPASTGYTTIEELDGANICVLSGTTTELNLAAVFGARGIAFNPQKFETDDLLRPAYEQGQCEAWTTDSSALAAWKSTLEAEGVEEQFIMPEIISKEPLGPLVADGDTEWAQAVNWSVLATIQAWEFGLDSTNIGSYTGEDPNILNFIGTDGFDPGLGLSPTFAVDIVSQVGNYQEIFEANIVPLGLTIEGSPNNLWTEGGLLYAWPYR
jgi:general L-amino acid transport system substrate-binding protein